MNQILILPKKVLIVDIVLVVPPSPVVSFCAAACWAALRPLFDKAAAWAAAAAASVAAFFALSIAAAGFVIDARAWTDVSFPGISDVTFPGREDTTDLVFDTADVIALVPDFATSDIFDPALFRKLSILLS